MANEVQTLSKMGWLKQKLSVNTGLLKSLPFIGLAAGAAAMAPFVLNSLRTSRRFDEDTPLPMPKSLSDPLPAVLDFTPAEPAQPAIANPHFGQPLQEGELGKRIRMQRSNIASGPDVTAPSITVPGSDISVIDGKPLKKLDGKHVNNVQQDASGPSFDRLS